MVKLTMIACVTDGLPLAEGMDDSRDIQDADFYKQQVKALFKNLSRGHNEASRMSVETGPYIFHYTIEGRVCYLTLCDRAYPKKLAFQYLEDLKNEFELGFGNQIETPARPYAFIKFDAFIQRTKKLYEDTQTQRNISKLNDKLYEEHQIMTRNVQEVLGVGEKLDHDDVIPSEILGKPCGSKFNTVTFVLNEFLTSLSGEYENGRLVSIVFGTNKTTHGPFGRTARSSSLSNDDFSFQFGPRDCFGGFHGSVDNGCVHSIGVYVKPFEFSFDEMKRRF